MTINSNIEEYVREMGQRIGRILIINKDNSDMEIQFSSIEKEIYEASLSYARIFFFETQSYLLEEAANKRLRFTLQTRFNIKPRKVEKMSNIDLIANCIKLEVLDSFEKAGLVTE